MINRTIPQGLKSRSHLRLKRHDLKPYRSQNHFPSIRRLGT